MGGEYRDIQVRAQGPALEIHLGLENSSGQIWKPENFALGWQFFDPETDFEDRARHVLDIVGCDVFASLEPRPRLGQALPRQFGGGQGIGRGPRAPPPLHEGAMPLDDAAHGGGFTIVQLADAGEKARVVRCGAGQ